MIGKIFSLIFNGVRSCTAGLLLSIVLISSPTLASLTLSTSVTPDPVEAGESFMMTLTVTNTDSFDRSDVVLTLRYPDNLEGLAYSYISDGGDCGGGSSCNMDEILTWNLGTLRAGQGKIVTFPPTVSTTATEGMEIDFADIELTDSSGETVSARQTIPIVSDRILELSLHELIEPVQPGGELTYILSYGQSKASTQVSDAELILVLPEGVDLVSASGHGVFDNGQVHWNLGSLGPGDSGQETVTLTVDSSTAPGMALHAQAWLKASGEPDTTIDETTRVEAETPLRLAIEAAPDPASPDGSTRIALTVSNTSNFERSNVTLWLRYPKYLAGLAYSYISDGGDCGGGSSCNTHEWISWDLGTLEGGSGRTVTLPPQVTAEAPKGALIPLLPVMSDSTGLLVEAGRTLLINDRELELAIAEALDPVQPGQRLNLDLFASNSKPSSSASGLQLEFPLPDGAMLSSASDGGLLQNDHVVWDLGTLNSGEVAYRHLELDIDSAIGLGSLLTSQARLTGSGQIEVRDDMVSRVESETLLRAVIEVQDPTPTAQPGDTLGTWLEVENLSAFPRSGVGLYLRYPKYLAGLAYSYISDGGDCGGGSSCNTNEWLSWSFDSLAAGGLKDVDLPPVVSSSTLPGRLIFFDAVVADTTARSRTEYVLPVGTLVEPADSYALNLSVSGSGRVSSSPGGIDCNDNCSGGFEPGTVVTLTATPETDWQFAGWGGACTGTTDCSLTINSPLSVTANFTELTNRYHLDSPVNASFESGIGITDGWVCEADRVEVQIDDAPTIQTAYGAERPDSQATCGDTANGFAATINWNNYGDGAHTLSLLADGQILTQAEVRVTTLGEEFLKGLSATTRVADFPEAGLTPPWCGPNRIRTSSSPHQTLRGPCALPVPRHRRIAGKVLCPTASKVAILP